MTLQTEFSKLTRKELLDDTGKLVAEERRITASLLKYLAEIDRRKLHLEMGFGSLFELLVKYWGYSEAAAGRRIAAMRLSKEVPEVSQAIETGKLSLSAASQIQNFFRNEQREGRRHTPEDKAQLVRKLEGRSRRECERELLKIAPPSAIPKERERIVSPEATEIRFVADDKLMAKFEKLKQLLAHSCDVTGALGYAELFDRLAEIGLKKLDPER